MKKNYCKIFIILIVMLSLFLSYTILHKKYSIGNIEHVEKIIENNNEHTIESINATMDLIEKKFNTNNFKGYTLRKIIYEDGNITDDYESYLKRKYNTNEVIMLSIEYNSSIFSSSGYTKCLLADIICVSRNGKWEIISWGLG